MLAAGKLVDDVINLGKSYGQEIGGKYAVDVSRIRHADDGSMSVRVKARTGKLFDGFVNDVTSKLDADFTVENRKLTDGFYSNEAVLNGKVRSAQ